jgi:hypothetical protein
MTDAPGTISVTLFAGLELRAREPRTRYRLDPREAATVGAVTIAAAPAAGDALANGSLTAASLAVSNATGTVGISANVTSTGNLTKTGAGTLALTSGTSSFAGIGANGGTLTVNGVVHAAPDRALAPGDEVALFPPLGGG